MAYALIPAAGRSERMGESKPMMPFGESTILGCLIESLQSGGATRVLVVRSPADRTLGNWCVDHEIEAAINPKPDDGMLSTVQIGVEALGGSDTFASSNLPLLVSPADHPAIQPTTVRRLLDRVSEGRRLAVPSFRGRRGHPLAIGSDLIASIPALDPTIGLRQLLSRHADRLQEVDVDDEGVLLDLDTPEEYQRALQHMSGHRG